MKDYCIVEENPVSIFIPECKISVYLISLIAGIIGGVAIAAVLQKKSKIKYIYIISGVMINTVLVIYFGVIGDLVTGFREGVISLNFTSVGGAVGMITGTVVMFFVTKNHDVLKAGATAIPFMYSVSKIGCLFSGCCGGREYYGPGAVTYTGRLNAVYSVPTFPVQLLETVCFMIVFIVMLTLYNRVGYLWHVLVNLYLCATLKFVIDFLRVSHEGVIISLNQICCIVLVIIVTAIMMVSRKFSGSKSN